MRNHASVGLLQTGMNAHYSETGLLTYSHYESIIDSMRIITKAQITRASIKYPDAKKALEQWFKLMKAADFNSFAEVKTVFGSADLVGRIIVFDIRGNHYRLIAAIHYNTKTVFVLEVLTHEEYDQNTWKKRYKIYD